MFGIKKLVAVSMLVAGATAAQAAPLFSTVGFGAGDTTVTFDEIAVAGGTAVTNQYSFVGVNFSTNGPSPWLAAGNPGGYSSNPNFSGNYLDSFTGRSGSAASVYSIQFSSAVDAAGAFLEFNTGFPAATFSAYLNNVLVESFNYNNVSCCSSTEFVGFSSILFDEIRISNITGTDFIMDNLSFSAVPEPESLALLGLSLAGLLVLRKKAKA